MGIFWLFGIYVYIYIYIYLCWDKLTDKSGISLVPVPMKDKNVIFSSFNRQILPGFLGEDQDDDKNDKICDDLCGLFRKIMIIIIVLSWTRLSGSMWIVILWWSMWNVFFYHTSQPRFTRITSRFGILTLKTQDVCHLHHCSWLIIHLVTWGEGLGSNIRNNRPSRSSSGPKGKFMKICQ